MSYPVLYNSTETEFEHNGLGILKDCVSCEVTEEANGIFELSMQYPMDGIHFSEIVDRSIVKVNLDPFRNPQLFRIYSISKPMSGIVTISAQHISYDLSGIPVSPFSADSVSSSLLGLKNNAAIDCPFDFWTDKSTSAKFKVETPSSIRSKLGGSEGSILDVYGGQYEFDNYTVKLHNSRGMNRGVSIRYGKNLTDINQERNCSSVFTGVYPYWSREEEEKMVLVELPEKIIDAEGNYNFKKILTLDLTSDFDEEPTIEQLRERAEKYVKDNKIGIPTISLTISFYQLEQNEEYKHLKFLERVSLFDTVNVEFPALGVSATAKVSQIVYDVINDRVKSANLGDARSNIADTLATQQQEIDYSKEKPSLSLVQKISAALSKAIMGAKGGAVRLIDTNDDGEPDELYIADKADPNEAKKVWRFNYNGWAASQNGYNGPFKFGATLEHGLLSDFVTAAQLVAGTIKSQDNGKTFFLDLDNGILNIDATSLNISGKTVEEIVGEEASSAVGEQTQEDIYNKLVDYNPSKQGLILKDGRLFIDASYISTGILGSGDGKISIDLTGGAEPVFNTGISTNGLTVRADEAEAKELFSVYAKPHPLGGYYGDLRLNGLNGEKILRATQIYEREDLSVLSGSGIDLYNVDGTEGVRIQSSSGNSRVEVIDGGHKCIMTASSDDGITGILLSGGAGLGTLGINQAGETFLQVDHIIANYMTVGGRKTSWAKRNDDSNHAYMVSTTV